MLQWLPEWHSIAVLRCHYSLGFDPIGQRTVGPASSRLDEGLAMGALLGSSCSSDSLWRSGRLQADFGHQVNGVSSDMLVQLASGLSVRGL